jgi:DUF1680 family protein
MNRRMLRREFLKAAPTAAWALARTVKGASFQAPTSSTRILIEPFDYQGVKLRESRWQDQVRAARNYYAGLSEDDILKGFRAAAGLPAPGNTLGGWCERNSATVFGQWLSGMSRMYRATGDGDLGEKAVRLMTEFSKTVKPDGDCGMRHYTFDKLVCGLVDLQLYAGRQDAMALLEKITDWASRTFDRENVPATPMPKGPYSGRPGEWYTLSENLYRAYQVTGNPKFKTFAEVWLYHPYWNKFANTAAPTDAQGVHAYSHVNTFSSAARAYAVTGDTSYLRIIKNAYDFLDSTQCYATGGYGPNENVVATNGSLGKALETRSDTFETPCGSWAGFKLARYLMEFTGEARYGDWIERLFYNGIGAALPITTGGKNFYYSDYRLGGGMKVYNWETYTCCSGTYIQDVADYHNLIYYKDRSGLYVNLYVPSEVVWSRPEGEVKLVQDTQYPETDTSTFSLDLKRSMDFSLKFRVPRWARGLSLEVNGAPANVAAEPGTWASLDRIWNPGDRVEARIPLRFRTQPVDRWHPHWIAVVRGPVVFVEDNSHHSPEFRLPESDDQLNTWLVPDDSPGVFRLAPLAGRREPLRFLPFYAVPEVYPYRMYIDVKDLPIKLW